MKEGRNRACRPAYFLNFLKIQPPAGPGEKISVDKFKKGEMQEWLSTMITLNYGRSYGDVTDPTSGQPCANAQQQAEAVKLCHRDTIGCGRAATANPLPPDAFWHGTLEVDEELTLTLEAPRTTAMNQAANYIFQDPPSRRTPSMPSPANPWKTQCKPPVGDSSASRLSWSRRPLQPQGDAPPFESATAPAAPGGGPHAGSHAGPFNVWIRNANLFGPKAHIPVEQEPDATLVCTHPHYTPKPYCA